MEQEQKRNCRSLLALLMKPTVSSICYFPLVHCVFQLLFCMAKNILKYSLNHLSDSLDKMVCGSRSLLPTELVVHSPLEQGLKNNGQGFEPPFQVFSPGKHSFRLP